MHSSEPSSSFNSRMFSGWPFRDTSKSPSLGHKDMPVLIESSDEGDMIPLAASRPSQTQSQRALSAASPKERLSKNIPPYQASPPGGRLPGGAAPNRSADTLDQSPPRIPRSSIHSSGGNLASVSLSQSLDPVTKPSSHLATPSSSTSKVHQTPQNRTPSKGDLTVGKIVETLRTFSKDIQEDHARLVYYTLEQQPPQRRRHLSSHDDLGTLSLTPLTPPVEEPDTMKVKLKRHGKQEAKGTRTYVYKITCIKTDKERVPKYMFHHVEIPKNILTPNTMLKFVPHLRDLEASEESIYNGWLKGLFNLDSESGFKTSDRESKAEKILKAECIARLSLYLERWIKRLGIEDCNKSTLIRYMATQSERDDAITPQQKSSILNSYSDEVGSPRASKTAKLFTQAFDSVFNTPSLKHRAVSLRDILMLDESVETIVDAKKLVKEGTQKPKDEEMLERVEQWLTSYSILGCMVCYSHSCEHGEYDAENQKRTFSIDSVGKLGGLLREKRIEEAKANLPNGTPKRAANHQPCKNQCFCSYDAGNASMDIQPWTDKETMLLSSLFMVLGSGSIRPQCTVAQLLGRKCWDVHRRLKELNLNLPEVKIPPEPTKVRTLHWYDRNRKALSGDWQEQTITHEHARRELVEPCHHDGPCTASNGCPCVKMSVLCERFCRCTAENCPYKFTGCACHSSGKTCMERQKEGKPCICVQLNRECDPVLCKGCGAKERADPHNSHDDVLHATGCQNCALQRGVSKTVVLGSSQLEGCGYGLFTAEDIAQDEFVIEYTGELISHDEGVRREARRGNVFDEGATASYLFTLLEQEGTWVDAAMYGNLSRYINHASENDKNGCNIMPKILYVNGEYRIRFAAIRDIRAGEELFFNYGENFPNLTKKLLEDQADQAEQAEQANGADARGGAKKRRGGRARKENGRKNVARKTTANTAAEMRKVRGARKQAPDPSPADASDWAGEDDEVGMATEDRPRRTRKRKRRVLDTEEEEVEEEGYHPEVNDSQEDTDTILYEKPTKRLNSGRRQYPRQPLQSASRRGGGRNGRVQSGLRQQIGDDTDDADDDDERVDAASTVPRVVSDITNATAGNARGGIRDAVGNGMSTVEWEEMEIDAEGNDTGSYYDDDDVVDRSRRRRQKPARYRVDLE